jgi:putative transcriptional regulator
MRGVDERAWTRGRLLVATPVLVDSNFDRTVVLMLEHSEDGALGLVLNRPLDVDLLDTLPEWSPVCADPQTVFGGGPVQPEAAFCLAQVRRPTPGDAWTSVLGDVGVADLGRGPSDVPGGVVAARIFAGYAGWSPAQLEGELAQGAWWVVDAVPDDVMTDAPGGLWRRVLRRQRAPLSWVANYPDDPNDN